jgi:ABC-2 type transport system permease protein
MKVLIAAYYEFIKNIRDIKMLAVLIIFPMITTVILGNSVGKFLSKDSSKRITVGYINKDTGSVGNEFEKFLNSTEIKKRIEIVNFSDKSLGLTAIDNGKINTMIYLARGLSQEVQAGKKQSILIYGKNNVEFVESLVDSFTSIENAVNAVVSTGGVLKTNSGSSIKRIFYTKDAKMPKPIDYYAVLNLLQMLILGGIFGVFITTRDYGSDMHIRIHSLPVSRWTLVGGRILGSVNFLFLSSIIIMMFTKFVLGANWDGNIFIILGTLYVFCSISVGLGVLIGFFIHNFSTALMLLLILMMFFSTVSGAISPSVTNLNLGVLAPNYHAKLMIFGTIYGYSRQVMQNAALWLGGFMLMIYGICGVVIGRAKNDNI